ncbi:unnamed protein product [Meloidogyne enterolobii]|uniref:Uncharacterized protein n=1 Tax=Meloidogyne enterolobii TaxID=390850 RepID=A0ACB1B0X5_MELEN
MSLSLVGIGPQPFIGPIILFFLFFYFLVSLRQVNPIQPPNNSVLRDIKTEIMPLSPDYLQYKNNTKNLKMEAVNEGTERGGGERGGGRWRHDDIPKEKIIGILEAEKAKILEQESNNYLNRELGLSSIKNGDLATTTTHSSRKGKSVGNVDNEYLVSNKTRRSKDTLSDHQQRPSKSLSPSRNFFDPPFAPTQTQIDKYSSHQLDIEDIARRMREFMSKNAISQSQIGDNVVGLSQASLLNIIIRFIRVNGK